MHKIIRFRFVSEADLFLFGFYECRVIYSSICNIEENTLTVDINGAIIASHIIAHEDVRNQGSGNAGLTNFIRGYGIQNTLLVFLLDGGKAVLACLIGGWLLGNYGMAVEGRMLGGLFVIVGHVFPAIYDFKGGKGILSGFFVALTVDWRVALIILAVFSVISLRFLAI